MLIPNRMISETEQRYRARAARRAVSLRRGDWRDSPLKANGKDSIYRRLERVELPHAFADVAAATTLQTPRAPAAAMDLLRFERILGRSDLIGIRFLESGYDAARAVARVVLRDAERRLIGYGTGFLVSPRLLLTNNHVLESMGAAASAEVQFNYEDGMDGTMKMARSFKLDPATFFLTNVDLDYTLVALAAPAAELSAFGFNRLIEDEGKVLVGEFVNIIQHPNGEPKQLAIRENQIVDLLDDFLHYETDTAPGSSGSPVFNDQWEVVCLHHSGVPATSNGTFLTVDGKPWTPDMGEQRLKWVANEGVRISRIVKDIKARVAGSVALTLVDGIFNPAQPVRETGIRTAATPAAAAPLVAASPLQPGHVSWTIPLTVSVNLGGLVAAHAAQASDTRVEAPAPAPRVPSASLPAVDAAASLGLAVEERQRSIDEYANRSGYDALFLGSGVPVPLPGLGQWKADAPSVAGAPAEARSVLRYTNFSVVMSRSRRMPVVTAVNIDGTQLRNLPRGGDTWYFDPRIPEEAQAGNDVYVRNPLDRGHMVRRLDPVWGSDAVTANEDTFHYTNACPQHANLNQRTWNELEDYILGNSGAHGLRVCVFTGPVLRDDDPEYRGIQLPREFWKIAALVDDETGQLAASGYLLSQASMIGDLREFAFGSFRTFQVPIVQISRLTGLDFSELSSADAMGDAPLREASRRRHPIVGPNDIIFRRTAAARRSNGSAYALAP